MLTNKTNLLKNPRPSILFCRKLYLGTFDIKIRREMDKSQLKKLVLEYLSKNRLMTLATTDGDKPWAATVFFNFDKDLNIYFISRPDTRKTENLTKNSSISVVINQYQPRKGGIKGVQLEGSAAMLDKTKNRDLLDLYRKRFTWADEYLHDHELFKITPTFIRFLDDERFGPGGVEELILG